MRTSSNNDNTNHDDDNRDDVHENHDHGSREVAVSSSSIMPSHPFSSSSFVNSPSCTKIKVTDVDDEIITTPRTGIIMGTSTVSTITPPGSPLLSQSQSQSQSECVVQTIMHKEEDLHVTVNVIDDDNDNDNDNNADEIDLYNSYYLIADSYLQQEQIQCNQDDEEQMLLLMEEELRNEEKVCNDNMQLYLSEQEQRDDTNNDLEQLVAHCERRDQQYPYQHQYNTTNDEEGGSSRRRELGNLGRCIICLEAYRTHVFVPCGHLCVCHSCASKVVTTMNTSRTNSNQQPQLHNNDVLPKCPFCKQTVEQVIKIYIP